jgi:hypothetical protein
MPLPNTLRMRLRLAMVRVSAMFFSLSSSNV